MTEAIISAETLRRAEAEGAQTYLEAVLSAIQESVGGVLTAETMAELTASQTTLWAYAMLREEVMMGGYVQLLHNGYGPFLFHNPFAKLLRTWGLVELSKQVYAARKLFAKHREALERDCTDEEFMALYEQMPEFDALDDEFVEHEEDYAQALAQHVAENLSDFVSVD